jgi:hypothetical protein
VLLDEVANEELAVHAHDMRYLGDDLDVETSKVECFPIYLISIIQIRPQGSMRDLPIVNVFWFFGSKFSTMYDFAFQ